jgi:hypothetical protein
LASGKQGGIEGSRRVAVLVAARPMTSTVASIKTPGVPADAARSSLTRRPTDDHADDSDLEGGVRVGSARAPAASLARARLSTIHGGQGKASVPVLS